MYYLYCVGQVLPDTIDDRLQDYRNYYYLRRQDQLEVLRLCETDSTDELDGKLFFMMPGLCGPNSGNEFYEITAAQSHLFASEGVIIAGRRQTVTTVMVYKYSWWKRNYHEPKWAERGRLDSSSDDSDCVIL